LQGSLTAINESLLENMEQCAGRRILRWISEYDASEDLIDFRIAWKSVNGTTGIVEYPTVCAKHNTTADLFLAGTFRTEALLIVSHFHEIALPTGRDGHMPTLEPRSQLLDKLCAKCFLGSLWLCLGNSKCRSKGFYHESSKALRNQVSGIRNQEKSGSYAVSGTSISAWRSSESTFVQEWPQLRYCSSIPSKAVFNLRSKRT
jgi:hypothetical protein